MKKLKLYFNIMLLIIVCCFVLCTTAFAASGFLRVVIIDENKEYIENFNVEICRVASFDGTSYTLTEEFSDLFLSADELSKDLSTQKSEQVFKYVLDNDITGQVIATDTEGASEFTGLDLGVYIVFERGGQAVSFRPYLLAVPANADTEPQYSIYSLPKTLTSDTQTVTVKKIWDDENNDANHRPQILDVTLYRDGVAVRTVTLSENCGWQHTFFALPKSEAYTVGESNLVDYTASCNQDGSVFTLTNTYTPPQTPDEPQLPQTGFKPWPVYLLLGAGSVLVVLGLADLCLNRRKNEE